MRRKHNLPDLSPEELVEYAEAAVARMTPEQRAEAERQGLV
jgi:hypothetical protein